MKFIIALFLSSISSPIAAAPAPSQSPSKSAAPSESPSDQPSSKPSESPSDMPSSVPSETPSCTPSKAPTPSPSINLFYPDQSTSGWESGCLNDGAQPAWMEANPTTWLFSTLDKCCATHFAWNYEGCMGTLDDTCARALWYPDWEGENKACKRDGNEPYYMTANPTVFMFSTKADCCEEHYSFAMGVCTGNGVSSLASGNKWYADWSSGDETCQNDGQAPQYMVDNMNLWLYDDRDACCKRFFNYKYADCVGGAAAAPSGRYFPDWEGDNEGCLVDSTTTPAPEYMSSGANTWLHATLDECCEQHYGYRVEECKGVTAPASAGTEKWYIDWADFTCVKDCVVSSSDPDCGGLADTYGSSNLHADKRTCCTTHMSYDFKACFN